MARLKVERRKKLNHPEFHPLSYFHFVFYLCVREINFLLFIFLNGGPGSCLPSHDGWWRGNLEVDVRVYMYAELLCITQEVNETPCCCCCCCC